eukprot:315124_1
MSQKQINNKFIRWNAASLHTPPLHDIEKYLQKELPSYFKESTITVTKCPDLSTWGNIASKGICGNSKLVEVGGPRLIQSNLQRTTYSMSDVLNICNMSKGLFLGAASVSSNIVGNNAELIPNIFLNNKQTSNTINNSHYAMINKYDSPTIDAYNSCNHGCFANLFLCDGHNNDNVLYVRCKSKIGDLNFVSAIRTCLVKYLKDKGLDHSKQIGMGGVIKILNGKIHSLIMPNYPNYKNRGFGDLITYNNIEMKKWLNFYDFGPNLIMMSCIVTDDPTEDKLLDVRHEHTHFYSLDKTNQGGHYIDSATPDEIEYEAYFSLAKVFYRIDDAKYKLSKL